MNESGQTVLITGCAGHAGQGVAEILHSVYRVRGLDLKPAADCDEMTIGSVEDIDTCRLAVQGIWALVTCHMGRNPEAYEPPFRGIDIGIRGMMNLYQAALEAGVRRVVQVSSSCHLPPGANGNEPPDGLLRRVNPHYGAGVYALSKTVEEMIGGMFMERHGVVTTLLRPGWIVRDDDGQTKYGQTQTRYQPELIDPLDLGSAVLCCLRRDARTVEGFVVGQPEYLETRRTMEQLGWEPTHRFETLREKPVQ